MKSNRLKSFTLMEVVIVMLISVTVLGIAYLAFSIVNKQLLNYKQTSEKINETMLFCKLVRKDISNANWIYKTAAGFSCRNDSSQVEYEINDSLILRISVITDSLKLKTTPPSFYYQEKEVVESGDIIDEFKIDIIAENERIITVSEKKLYDARSLMSFDK